MSTPRRMSSGPGLILSAQNGFMQSPTSNYFPDVSSLDSSLAEKVTVESPPARSGSGVWHAPKRRWIPRPEDPVQHPARTLILCFDGTGDQFDNDNSNVVQFVAALKKDDPSRQMVYYQPGIGTETNSGPGFRAFSKAMDLMLAWSLGKHVRDGYEFLMQNYSEGDKIAIFGFSRGAYTALGLAGMLQKVGLLPPYNKQQLPFAYHMYSREDDESLLLATEFKETFSTDVVIDFVGVWDTVCSVGFVPRYLPFVTSNACIKNFRHALALDEHRAKFMPNFHRQWDESADNGILSADSKVQEDIEKQVQTAELVPIDSPVPMMSPPPKGTKSPVGPSGANGVKESGKKSPLSGSWLGRNGTEHKEHKKPQREDTLQELFEERVNKASGRKTNSLEVWFAGAHADVGGGSVPNHTRHSLARIPLRWMIRECFNCKTGIIFDMNMLKHQYGMDVDTDRERILDPPERLHPAKHDFLPAPRLAKEDELESLLKATGKTLWYTLTFPIRAVARIGQVFLSSNELAGYEHPTAEHLAMLGASALERDAAREPFKGEAAEELHDALSPAYDQLRLARHWWILEWVPLKHKKGQAMFSASQKASDYHWLINRGEGRKVFKAVVKRGLKVHRSVLTRLEALDEEEKDQIYVPRIKPNIVVDEGLPHERRVCRRMTHEEWVEQKVNGLEMDKPWLEWVSGSAEESRGAASVRTIGAS